MKVTNKHVEKDESEDGILHSVKVTETYDNVNKSGNELITNIYFRLEKECGMSNGDYPIFSKITINHEFHFPDPQAIIDGQIAKIGIKCGFTTLDEAKKYIISINQMEYEQSLK